MGMMVNETHTPKNMSKVYDFSELSGMGHVKMARMKSCNIGLLLLPFCESAFLFVAHFGIIAIETTCLVFILRYLYICDV